MTKPLWAFDVIELHLHGWAHLDKGALIRWDLAFYELSAEREGCLLEPAAPVFRPHRLMTLSSARGDVGTRHRSVSRQPSTEGGRPPGGFLMSPERSDLV